MINAAGVELLAPAGALPQLKAAVRSGADAVYFGATDLNARRSAANFTEEEFISAVKYCHTAGVKCYITLNTLITDDETDKLHETLELIVRAGADAVIVQDLAAARAVFTRCPSLPVHASTQMAVHNAAGAKLLDEMGFARIVTARELSIKEIKAIAKSVNAEIEVFVHGAHCMSASGMCYMSSAFGARSGNRGLCAQPCRLNFKSRDREYALSLKDMCLAEHLGELAEAGVASFKIEGRMKRPEYVAATVCEYKKAMSGDKPDIKLLRDIFSRSGFTDGYATGKRDLSMFGYRTKEDVTAAEPLLKNIARTFEDEIRTIPVTVHLTVKRDMPSKLTLSDGTHTVTSDGDIPEEALKVSLDGERAERSLTKFGGTVYYCDNFTCDIDSGLMLSAASLNAMRRAAAELLSEKRSEKTYELLPREKEAFVPSKKNISPELRLRFVTAEQIPGDTDCGLIILPLGEIIKTPSLITLYKDRLCAELPALIYPENEQRITDELHSLKAAGLVNVMCENIGAVAIAKKAGLNIKGGALLNILNSSAAEEWYKLGVTDMTLSAVMSFELMKKLHTRAYTGFTAYGHMPLMHFRCCPMKQQNGCGGCTGKSTVTDRRGEKFTVLCNDRNFSVLYNPIPLYTGDMEMPLIGFVTLYFTTETKNECSEIINCFINKKSIPGKKTTGLYNKKLF